MLLAAYAKPAHLLYLAGRDRQPTLEAGLRAAGRLSDAAFNAQLGGAGYSLIARAPDANGNVVELNYYNTGGAFLAKNQAYYIQDSWKPIDRLTLNYNRTRQANITKELIEIISGAEAV